MSAKNSTGPPLKESAVRAYRLAYAAWQNEDSATKPVVGPLPSTYGISDKAAKDARMNDWAYRTLPEYLEDILAKAGFRFCPVENSGTLFEIYQDHTRVFVGDIDMIETWLNSTLFSSWGYDRSIAKPICE